MKWKHIIGDVEVNRDLVLLLLIGGLYTLAISLSNTFVNIYLWKQTQNYVNLACIIWPALYYSLSHFL
ncbi:hypothetical protein B353_01320 [Bacillus anthracis str. UR-1]|nr:hypothetical protein B353_01320 [Bacillus anthracis str. UR-1]